VEAILYSAEIPSNTQRQQLISFLKKKYNSDVILTWKEDKELSKDIKDN
jgi:F0F1-type ATP synthase delta subunit